MYIKLSFAKWNDDGNNKIPTIKALRVLSGMIPGTDGTPYMSRKKAKEMVEEGIEKKGIIKVEAKADPEEVTGILETLGGYGVFVRTQSSGSEIFVLRKMASDLMNGGEYEKAIDLAMVLSRWENS